MLFQLLFDAQPSPSSLARDQVGGGVGLLFLLVLVVAMVAVVWFVRRTRSSGTSNWEAAERKRFQKAWEELNQLAKQGGAPGRKLAMIEADKLVDTVLRKRGFPGETMAERLKVAEYQHPAIKHMWNAHRWRNQLVHEAHFSLSERQVREALQAFEAVLRSFQAL